MADPPMHNLYAYEPPASLWKLVVSHLPSHETEEVKNLLGEDLVDQSLELHGEVETLLEIWQDYRDETQETLMHTRLPEPPAARERLKQEIQFLVDSIHEKAKENGRNVNGILSKHNKEVLHYALEEQSLGGEGSSRPSTARSQRDGRETPLMRSTPDRLSSHTSSVDDVETMNDKLNVVHLEEVVEHLRLTLTEEARLLMEDIEFLQKCLDDEADFRCNSRLGNEPSLADLRGERSLLEKELLSSEPSVPAVMRENSSSIRSLEKPESGRLRVTPPSTPCTPISRPSPLKANHALIAAKQTFQGQGRHDQGESVPPRTSAHHNCTKTSSETRGKADICEGSRARRKGHAAAVQSGSLDMSDGQDHSHITIRTGVGGLPRSARIVKVASIPVNVAAIGGAVAAGAHVPSPPSSAKPEVGVRPSSASRFRNMILQCRD